MTWFGRACLVAAMIVAVGVIACSWVDRTSRAEESPRKPDQSAADQSAADQSAADQSAADRSRRVAALQFGAAANLALCTQALDGKDFKTLTLRAEGAVAVADAMARHGTSEAWQQACESLSKSFALLAVEGKKRNAEKAREAIATAQARLAEIKKVQPQGATRETVRSAVGLKSMMSLLDGTLAEGQVAVSVGEGEEAKNNAYVLAELARLMSNDRVDAGWKRYCESFAAAADQAASLPADSSTAAWKEKFRQVRQQCEACHNKTR